MPKKGKKPASLMGALSTYVPGAAKPGVLNGVADQLMEEQAYSQHPVIRLASLISLALGGPSTFVG
jgi:hypothetical protein